MSQTMIMIGHLVSMLLSPSVSRVLYSTSDPEGVNYNISGEKREELYFSKVRGYGSGVRERSPSAFGRRRPCNKKIFGILWYHQCD